MFQDSVWRSETAVQAKKQLEKLSYGYRFDHARQALQMAVALAICMVFVFHRHLYAFFGTACIWIVVTAAVAMGPDIGSSFRRATLGTAGTIVGTGIGMLADIFINKISGGDAALPKNANVTAAVATLTVALVGFIFALNRQRFLRWEYGWSIALMSFPIVVIPGYHSAGFDFIQQSKFALAALCGVVITSAVSAFVFPKSARGQLCRSCAYILEALSAHAYELFADFTEEEPAPDMRLPGAAGKGGLVDSGLAARHAEAATAELRLGTQLTQVSALVTAAAAEWRCALLRRERLSTDGYARILRASQRSLTTLANLLLTMEVGALRLGLCRRHANEIDAVRQCIAAAFTALSGLMRNLRLRAYAEAKMAALGEHVAALQAKLEAEPLKTGFDLHIETLAAVTTAAVQLTRQLRIIHQELCPAPSTPQQVLPMGEVPDTPPLPDPKLPFPETPPGTPEMPPLPPGPPGALAAAERPRGPLAGDGRGPAPGPISGCADSMGSSMRAGGTAAAAARAAALDAAGRHLSAPAANVATRRQQLLAVRRQLLRARSLSPLRGAAEPDGKGSGAKRGDQPSTAARVVRGKGRIAGPRRKAESAAAAAPQAVPKAPPISPLRYQQGAGVWAIYCLPAAGNAPASPPAPGSPPQRLASLPARATANAPKGARRARPSFDYEAAEPLAHGATPPHLSAIAAGSVAVDVDKGERTPLRGETPTTGWGRQRGAALGDCEQGAAGEGEGREWHESSLGARLGRSVLGLVMPMSRAPSFQAPDNPWADV